MIKKTLLILPYFGKLPNYFNLFLKSVGYNPDFNWLLVTDDETVYDYPGNIKVVYKRFDEIKLLIQNKFNFVIAIDSPFKFCDFKPAYGYIFEEYIYGYHYWGHCDPDIIWGKMSNFIDYKKLSAYDKLFTLGHLSIYKNTAANNRRFLSNINGEEHYRKVFSDSFPFAYDEFFEKSINTIFVNNNLPLYTKSYAADVDPYFLNFRLNQHQPNGTYVIEAYKNQLFLWDDGTLKRYVMQNDQLTAEEYCYIHIQKRTMKNNTITKNDNKFLILPFAFKKLDENITRANFNEYFTYFHINRQYITVKWRSFNYKLKHFKRFYSFIFLSKKK